MGLLCLFLLFSGHWGLRTVILRNPCVNGSATHSPSACSSASEQVLRTYPCCLRASVTPSFCVPVNGTILWQPLFSPHSAWPLQLQGPEVEGIRRSAGLARD